MQVSPLACANALRGFGADLAISPIPCASSRDRRSRRSMPPPAGRELKLVVRRPPNGGADAVASWLVDESVAEGDENGLELRVDAELVEDACDVVALGADADPEPVGDRLAVEAQRRGL